MIITGVGSRQTTGPAQLELKAVGTWVRQNGHVGRSGHAEGADYAFEAGAEKSCEVFLPWSGFNSQLAMLGNPIVVQETEALNGLVRKYHPAPQNLKRGGWALMRRNCCQILGADVAAPVVSDAVVYWAPGDKGGTGFAIKMGRDLNIHTFNLALPEWPNAATIIVELERICEEKTQRIAAELQDRTEEAAQTT